MSRGPAQAVMFSWRARLLAVVSALLLLIGGVWHVSARKPAAPALRLLVIVMDGFRPDYMTLAPMRHLHVLMVRGMTYDMAWTGQLQSETPPGHATIATGVYPRKHGVIGFGWRDPASGEFTFMPTNIGQIVAGDLYRVIEADGVPTISDLIHQRDRRDVTVSLSGEKLWASAPMGTGADYVLYGHVDPKRHHRFAAFAVGPNIPPARTGYSRVTAPSGAFMYQDPFAARVAVKLLDSLRPRAVFLNLPAADIAGHYLGALTHPRQMAPIIRNDDRAIGLVLREYQRLGLLSHTVVVVTADHGMVAGRQRVPIHQIYDAVRRSGIAWLDEDLRSSLGSIWLREPNQAPSLARILAADHVANVEGVLYKVPAGKGVTYLAEPSSTAHLSHAVLQADLDLADTEASANGADILLLYPENVTGMPLGKSFTGMHGGVSWNAQHIPLIIAGPGVRHGLSHFPAKLVDVAPTIERLLGLPIPRGVDGVVLADALTHPTVAERHAQQAVAPRRIADAHALEASSRAES